MNLEKWELKIVKAALSIVQGVATYVVFMKYNNGLPLAVRILLALCAVVTVDGMILYCFSVLENMQLPATEKRPWVALNILLTAAVFAIGYVEQRNLISFAPRLGLAALATVDVFLWWDQWQRERNTREEQERRIRDRMVIARRKAKEKAEKAALKILQAELEQRAIDTMRRDLGLYEAPLIDKPPAPTEKGDVVQLSARRWGWIDPQTGEVVAEGPSGPYKTERGAKIALSRAKKSHAPQMALFSD